MSLEHTVVYPSVVYEVGDMEASQTRLELEATRELLKNGKFRLRCLATIFTLYRRSEEIELSEDTPHLQPVMDHTTPNGLGTAPFGAHYYVKQSLPNSSCCYVL
jgi:hypothetical protein